MLTATQAIQIYALKSEGSNSHENWRGKSQSKIVGQKFGVSPKTIRDIWNRRTWKIATYPRDMIMNNQHNPTFELQVTRKNSYSLIL